MHSILQRTLEAMSHGSQKDSTDQKVSELVAAMQDAQLYSDEPGQSERPNDDRKWTELLATMEDEALSFAQINQKRKRLTFEAFRCPKIFAKTVAIDGLMKPNVEHMHILFKRSGLISKLEQLPQAAVSERAALQEELLDNDDSDRFMINSMTMMERCNIIRKIS